MITLYWFLNTTHNSVVDIRYGARQSRPGSITTRIEFLLAALPGSSSQGTSIDLQNGVILLLSRMDKTKSNMANANKTNNILSEIITAANLQENTHTEV